MGQCFDGHANHRARRTSCLLEVRPTCGLFPRPPHTAEMKLRHFFCRRAAGFKVESDRTSPPAGATGQQVIAAISLSTRSGNAAQLR